MLDWPAMWNLASHLSLLLLNTCFIPAVKQPVHARMKEVLWADGLGLVGFKWSNLYRFSVSSITDTFIVNCGGASSSFQREQGNAAFGWEYLHVTYGMEGICIWNCRSKFSMEKPPTLDLSRRIMHESKKCVVKRNWVWILYLQCSPWPDTPTTFVNNSPTPAPTFTSAQHNTYSVPDR